MRAIVFFALLLGVLWGGDAHAQGMDLKELLPAGPSASGRIVQLMGLISVLSIAPGLLVTVTCFTRLIIALSFLRAGLGLPSSPSNIVLISLALFMTFLIMGPTLEKVWSDGVQPYVESRIDEREAYQRVTKPIRDFMRLYVRDKDLQLFEDLARRRGIAVAAGEAGSDLRLLIPAFMISELRRGFEIGFLIMLPFLVIDLVVATIVMAMGMMMLSPGTISLPFKILFFVLIDGWSMLIGSLVRSFG